MKHTVTHRLTFDKALTIEFSVETGGIEAVVNALKSDHVRFRLLRAADGTWFHAWDAKHLYADVVLILGRQWANEHPEEFERDAARWLSYQRAGALRRLEDAQRELALMEEWEADSTLLMKQYDKRFRSYDLDALGDNS